MCTHDASNGFRDILEIGETDIVAINYARDGRVEGLFRSVEDRSVRIIPLETDLSLLDRYVVVITSLVIVLRDSRQFIGCKLRRCRVRDAHTIGSGICGLGGLIRPIGNMHIEIRSVGRLVVHIVRPGERAVQVLAFGIQQSMLLSVISPAGGRSGSSENRQLAGLVRHIVVGQCPRGIISRSSDAVNTGFVVVNTFVCEFDQGLKIMLNSIVDGAGGERRGVGGRNAYHRTLDGDRYIVSFDRDRHLRDGKWNRFAPDADIIVSRACCTLHPVRAGIRGLSAIRPSGRGVRDIGRSAACAVFIDIVHIDNTRRFPNAIIHIDRRILRSFTVGPAIHGDHKRGSTLSDAH